MKILHIMWVVLLGIVLPSTAYSKSDESWPKQVVTIVVPFPAGGATDVMARLFAPEIAAAINANVVVENRPGAGGTMGTQYVNRSASDGYTLLWGTVATHGIAPSIYKKLPYNVQEDFIPIVHVVDQPYVLVTHPSQNFSSMSDLIKQGKENPESLAASSAGIGTGAHMILEKFRTDSQVDLLLVPYKGAGPALIDLVGGQVDMTFDVILTSVPYIENKRLVPLAVTSAERSSALPDVPTMQEVGLDKFVAVGWNGLFARAGTPDHAVQKINQAVNEALQKPEIRNRLIKEGSIPVGGSIQDFASFIDLELKSWNQVAIQANITLD